MRNGSTALIEACSVGLLRVAQVVEFTLRAVEFTLQVVEFTLRVVEFTLRVVLNSPSGSSRTHPPGRLEITLQLVEFTLRVVEFTLQVLLRKGAKPNYETRAGYTALMRAAIAGHTAVMDLLISAGARPMYESLTGRTALVEAARVNTTSRYMPLNPPPSRSSGSCI
eukprot:1189804-Prorocentrum_minimum.AAC.2